MHKWFVLSLSAALAVSCAREPAAPAATGTPRASGLDAANFDRSVRPQDDIYRYVNGGWLSRTEIPAAKPPYGGFYEAHDRTQERLKVIVEEAAKATTKAPGADAQKLGDFYEAFMDETRVEALGTGPLAPELARVDAIATQADLARYMARMLMLNMPAPVVGGVDGDAQDPKTSVLTLFQGGIGLPDRDYYLKDDA